MNELIFKSRELTKRYQTSTSSCFQKFLQLHRLSTSAKAKHEQNQVTCGRTEPYSSLKENSIQCNTNCLP